MTRDAGRGKFEVPYGEGTLPFDVPDGVAATVLTSGQIEDKPDPRTAYADALDEPLGTHTLEELARGKRNVVIAVTDATRLCPDHHIVPPMLEAITRAGVADDDITILVAVGTHRASTEREKRDKLGDAIVDRYQVVDHDAFAVDELRHVADGPGGVPFLLNRRIVEADLVLATGRVEPHQYAGYSGGGKTVAIGCAGEEIIAYTHGPAMLDLNGVRLGELARNPFQQAVRRVARAAKVVFVGNVVLDDDGELVRAAYGAPEEVQDELAAFASAMYTASIPSQVDIAVAGVGSPKDVNLYQASRAASYLQFAPTPVVRDGGVIILPARCPEGFGDGAGERRFGERMGSGTATEILADIRANGLRPGEQRAYIMAQVLERVTVIVVGADEPDSISGRGFDVTDSMGEALQAAVEIVGKRASMLVVPHALLTLPVVQC